MKKTTGILWPFIILVMIMSCSKQIDEIKPVASFYLAGNNFEAGTAIEVENLSIDATSYLWQCGPVIYETNTKEKFMFVINEPGTYTLSLIAYNGAYKSEKTQLVTIVPKPKTTLTLKTVDDSHQSIGFCTIRFYASKADFDAVQNCIYTAQSDASGIYNIENIKPGTYWFDCYYYVTDNWYYINWWTTTESNFKINVLENKENEAVTVLKLHDFSKK